MLNCSASHTRVHKKSAYEGESQTVGCVKWTKIVDLCFRIEAFNSSYEESEKEKLNMLDTVNYVPV